MSKWSRMKRRRPTEMMAGCVQRMECIYLYIHVHTGGILPSPAGLSQHASLPQRRHRHAVHAARTSSAAHRARYSVRRACCRSHVLQQWQTWQTAFSSDGLRCWSPSCLAWRRCCMRCRLLAPRRRLHSMPHGTYWRLRVHVRIDHSAYRAAMRISKSSTSLMPNEAVKDSEVAPVAQIIADASMAGGAFISAFRPDDE